MEFNKENCSEVAFSFGVMTFNQSDTVLETLESIKYQVETYGKGKPTRLIITEDHSKDDTAYKCKKWIEQNKDLFCECLLLSNEENKGTVKNYLAILDIVKDEPLKIIAGDDLICFSTNIYQECEQLGKNTLKIGIPLFIENENIVYSDSRLIDIIYYSHKKISRNYGVNRVMRGGFFSTPSALYSKALFEKSNARNFLKKFRLFEDDPTWYSMMKNVEDINLLFSFESFVLYRLSNNSVSHNSNKKSPFYSELRLLHDEYKKNCDFLTRMLLFWEDSNAPRIIRGDLVYKKIRDLHRRRVVLHKYLDEYDLVCSKIKKMINLEQSFYNELIKNLEE